jgi:hypothetical protein
MGSQEISCSLQSISTFVNSVSSDWQYRLPITKATRPKEHAEAGGDLDVHVNPTRFDARFARIGKLKNYPHPLLPTVARSPAMALRTSAEETETAVRKPETDRNVVRIFPTRIESRDRCRLTGWRILKKGICQHPRGH